MATHTVETFIQHARGMVVIPMTQDEHQVYLQNVQGTYYRTLSYSTMSHVFANMKITKNYLLFIDSYSQTLLLT